MEGAGRPVPGVDYPQTSEEMVDWFRNDAGCREYLRRLSRPDGFTRPRCGTSRPRWAISAALRSALSVCSPPDFALSAVPGVASASVNLASETAQVSHGDQLDTAILTKTLSDAGYPAVSEEVTLEIEGMTCASCVGRVEKALKAGRRGSSISWEVCG